MKSLDYTQWAVRYVDQELWKEVWATSMDCGSVSKNEKSEMQRGRVQSQNQSF